MVRSGQLPPAKCQEVHLPPGCINDGEPFSICVYLMYLHKDKTWRSRREENQPKTQIVLGMMKAVCNLASLKVWEGEKFLSSSIKNMFKGRA